MQLVHAVILSIVEGITEFLPISSTGHLVLTVHLLHIPQTEFVKSFEITIQLGAILAVIALQRNIIFQNRSIWKKIIIAFIPTAIVGFTLYPFIKHVLLGNTIITLTAIFFGGIILILFEYLYKPKTHQVKTIEHMSNQHMILIGIFQSFSIIPGVSRSAASIIGGLIAGYDRKTAVQFSFLLAIPTILAATILDLFKSEFSFSSDQWMMLCIGFIGTFIVAHMSIKYFLHYIERHTFIPFGVYRILLALWYGIIFLQ